MTSYPGTELRLFAKATHYKSYLGEVLRPYLRGDVLEVGAGLGGTTPFLLGSAVSTWTCLEPDPHLARQITERLAAGLLGAACRVVLGTLDALPEHARYDCIVYLDVLEHIERDAEQLAQAAHHLRSGAHLVVLCPAHQWLFSPFDRAIGHYRRYDKASLGALRPPGARLERLAYLDSAGLLASAGNRLVSRSALPTERQIAVWDRVLVPVSRHLDPLLGYRLGKSVLAVWRKPDAAPATPAPSVLASIPMIPSDTPFARAAAHVRAGASARAEAHALVAQMTLEEKLEALDGDLPFWPGVVDLVGGGYWEHPWPAAKNARLGIPGLDFADGPRGCVLGPCTAFPVPMARGASFDPALEERVGAAIGAELRASGATFTGAVCMNLLRHPAWGRAQETYGEDPVHVGTMAASVTTGLQRHVMACMKHFALNSMENARFRVNVVVDERALHEVYLPHFKQVARAGVASVMSAYNSVNGEWCGQNAALLLEVLRGDWGFEGFVITDFTYGLRDAVRSVQAGCNIEMPFRQHRALHLPAALASGALLESTVDARVTESLATFLRFARVYEQRPAPEVIACPAHRALAREVASASMVLLRNEGALLPLDRSSLRRVAVLGKLADQPNLGDGGSSDVRQPDVTTPLAGVRAALPECAVVHSATDLDVVEGADVVLVVVGYTKDDEGEYLDPASLAELQHLHPPPDHPLVGFPPNYTPPVRAAAAERTFAAGGDRRSLRLRSSDEALILAAAARHPRVVVAVMSGSAVVMPWLRDVPATLMIWYPGMEGGHALCDVLLGSTEPGGRLPFAVPEAEADLVDFDPDATEQRYGLLHGQWWLDHHAKRPALPFGHGLGYTTFALDSAQSLDGDVVVTLRNTGARAGKAVVQAYGSVPNSKHLRPPRRLLGWQNAWLEPGASSTLHIAIDRAALDLRLDGGWVREPLPVLLEVGLDAASLMAVTSA